MSKELALRQYSVYFGKYNVLVQTLRRDAQTALHSLDGIMQELKAVEENPLALISGGKKGIDDFYDSLETVKKITGQYQEEPQREARETPEESRSQRGDLSRKVRKYVAVRTRQNRFELMQVAEDIGMKARIAPVYRVLQSIPYLKEREVKGRKVFDRK